jgi:hypothetical protein
VPAGSTLIGAPRLVSFVAVAFSVCPGSLRRELTSIGMVVSHTEHPDGATAAFVLARSLRLHREWLVAEVTAGQMSLADLQDHDASDMRVGTIKVVVLAEAVPTAGKVRARRAMAALGIPADARWGELDPSTATALWQRLETDHDVG